MELPPVNPWTPSSPEQEIQTLQENVSKLSAQVAQLERRVASLERSGPSAIAVAAGAANATPKLESRFGLTLVNRAGALTLAIGIIFFLKYAADNQWIGAEGRVTVGVVAGIGMLAAAEWMRRREGAAQAQGADQSVFAQGIAGCGLATIYVSLYACFGFYNLIVPFAGWTLLVLVSALAVILSIRYASAAIAGLGFVSGLLTPMLLHNKATAWWFDLLYLLVLGATALFIAVRQRWPLLIPGLAALAALSAGVLAYSKHPVAFAVFLVVLAGEHFAGMRWTRSDEKLTPFVYLTAHGCLLLAGIRMVAFWAGDSSSPDNRYSVISALESFLLGVYGLVMLVYGMTKRSAIDRALGLGLLGAVIAKLYLWDVWQLNRFYRISAFVALGILLLAASYLYSRFRSRAS